MNLRHLTGGLLLAVPVVFAAGFSGLQAVFDYPGILRQPAGEVLARFAAGGADLHVYWYLLLVAVRSIKAVIKVDQDDFWCAPVVPQDHVLRCEVEPHESTRRQKSPHRLRHREYAMNRKGRNRIGSIEWIFESREIVRYRTAMRLSYFDIRRNGLGSRIVRRP